MYVDQSIYASVADASGSSIPAAVKSVQTQFYNPTYTVPATLIGGANYARVSKVDIDAGAFHANTYFRSTDRFMPDGTTDATNGGYWLLSDPEIDPRACGATGDGATNDNTALVAAFSLKRPVRLRKGTYCSSAALVLPTGAQLVGDAGAEIKITTADATAISMTGVSGVVVRGLKLTAASAATKTIRSYAVNVVNATDCNISDLDLVSWPESGISVTGTPSTNTITRNIVIERIWCRLSQAPSTFSTACVYIKDHTQDITVRDCLLEDANCGILVQNIGSTYTPVLRGHRLINNTIRRMAQYGIVGYCNRAVVSITGAANNGVGLVRLTATAHGAVSGDQIVVSGVTGTVEANGLWLVDVIDANTVDLRGTRYANAWVSGGTLYVANPTDILIDGNTIEDIDGTPNAANGSNGNFGAGIYCVNVADLTIAHNTIRRTNLGTTTSSLAPACIGISATYGMCLIDGNTCEDSEWRGIYAVSSPNCNFTIANNTIRRMGREGISILAVDKSVVITGNAVIARPGSSSSQGFIVNHTTAKIKRAVIQGNSVTADGHAQPFVIQKVEKLTCGGNVVINEAPGTLTCEAAKFLNIDAGSITGNVFDGGLSGYTALTISAATNVDISGNYSAMTDLTGRACVSMAGTCTGTVYERSNKSSIGRMENTSTGGNMHTRDNTNSSGGKTRQIGDTIENTAPVASGTAYWAKVAASAGSADWKTLTLSA